jgi:hypothetical protein
MFAGGWRNVEANGGKCLGKPILTFASSVQAKPVPIVWGQIRGTDTHTRWLTRTDDRLRAAFDAYDAVSASG